LKSNATVRISFIHCIELGKHATNNIIASSQYDATVFEVDATTVYERFDVLFGNTVRLYKRFVYIFFKNTGV
jgi:hypothetical protein